MRQYSLILALLICLLSGVVMAGDYVFPPGTTGIIPFTAATANATSSPWDCGGGNTLTITVSGGGLAAGATVQIIASTDKSNLFANPATLPMTPIGGGAAVTTIITNGTYYTNISALSQLEAVIASYSSSSISVNGIMSVTDTSNANVIAVITGTSDVNIAEVGGTAVPVGNGTTDGGTQRVVIASDQSPFPVTIPAVTGTVTANIGTLNPSALFNNGKTVNVTNSATVLLTTNAARKGYAVVNNGSTDIYVGNATVADGITAQANGGFILKAGGGAIYSQGIGVYTGPVSAITDSSTSVVGVYEWLMQQWRLDQYVRTIRLPDGREVR